MFYSRFALGAVYINELDVSLNSTFALLAGIQASLEARVITDVPC
jgi:hypothetical protein